MGVAVDLVDLVALCPPPRRLQEADHHPGGTVERAIPAGHQEMTDLYGAGSFDNFVSVYERRCLNLHLDIDENTRLSAVFMTAKSIPALRRALQDFGTGPEDLVQWGGTDNADSLYWIPAGPPDEWPTLIVEAGQLDFMVVPLGSPSVILGLLNGTLTCSFFPEDFPSAEPHFFSGLAD
ncbi:hypothetical protein [Streptomyces sp. NPDC056785]|uniref:hypothetical protein n=1 Tax=Streptomyces sp. NPDC056785 TaxID=3345944 RepID=UPI0036AEE17D